jgi:hypothetical protein
MQPKKTYSIAGLLYSEIWLLLITKKFGTPLKPLICGFLIENQQVVGSIPTALTKPSVRAAFRALDISPFS